MPSSVTYYPLPYPQSLLDVYKCATGELETMYIKHSCRASNLRILLEDENIRPKVGDLVDAVEAIKAEDR